MPDNTTTLPARRMRSRLLLLGMIAPASLLIALLSAPTHGAQNAKPPTAKQKFNNIQVLKDLPADQLIPVMHAYNTELGVKCDFCHVIGPNHTGFEKDDKPTKIMARKMILMTRDINAHQKILRNQATCFLCHHGQPEPETKPDAQPADKK